jgi:Domain of unknown function (DUF6456)
MRQILAELPLPGDHPSRAARTVRSVTVNLAESPLAWLRCRGRIELRQFLAGEKLRQDYERAGLPQRVTMLWDAAPADKTSRGPMDHGTATVGQIDAKRRFFAAIDHVGTGLSEILWRVICACEGLPNAEKELGWPTRSGRVVLTLALDRLAEHYRIG